MAASRLLENSSNSSSATPCGFRSQGGVLLVHTMTVPASSSASNTPFSAIAAKGSAICAHAHDSPYLSLPSYVLLASDCMFTQACLSQVVCLSTAALPSTYFVCVPLHADCVLLRTPGLLLPVGITRR